tara:strand:- start:104 stop:973 length:870 start_codon:yes stop_codon:yes gene_type:complete
MDDKEKSNEDSNRSLILEENLNKEKNQNFAEIKNTTKEINEDIKENKNKISDSIKEQENELEKLYKKKEILKDDWKQLDQNKYQIKSEIINNQQELIKSTKEDYEKLKSNLLIVEKKLETTNQKNRELEINNHELKTTISRYINNFKNQQNQINKLKDAQSKNLFNDQKIEELVQRIKFFQEENVRLASDLKSFQNKYNIIKDNFNTIELERNQISQQIQGLNESVNKTSTNIVNKDFIEEPVINAEPVIDKESSINKDIKIEKNNYIFDEEEVKKLDLEINEIFKNSK